VTRASGSLEGDPRLNVSVESTHGAATTVFVEVRAPSQGLRDILDRCGVDSGYERVFCETEPSLLEVVRRGAVKGRLPDLIGRSYDERGSLLVELWGSDLERLGRGEYRRRPITQSGSAHPGTHG
jgi:hypothetical protein